MKREPLISIIVPVYNVEKYLTRCLDSILSQKLPSIEIICINDGSTDKSALILAEYAKLYSSFLKVISQSHQGVSSARNKGMDAAQGQWLMFVDSDDYVAENFLPKIVQYITPDLDLICWGAEAVCEEKKSVPWLALQNEHLKIRFKGKRKFTTHIALKTPIVLWNKLFKAEIIRQYAISFPEKCVFEDNSFFWKYFPFCRAAYFIQDKYYFYTQRCGSIMGQLFRHELSPRADGAKIGQDIAFFYLSKGLFYKYEKLLQKLFLSLFFLDFDHVPAKDRVVVLRQGQDILKTIPFKSYSTQLEALCTGNLKGLLNYNRPSFMERCFSIRKEDGIKYVYLLGFRIRLYR